MFRQLFEAAQFYVIHYNFAETLANWNRFWLMRSTFFKDGFK